ncbi:MAG: alpha/beta hydrolase [Lachnospiraceae bacterium]|nr:alpha/beta hydrolase [Lachnospiraceae bacterium]
MIHNIIREEIRVPGTLADTYLETFFLNVTESFTVQERPLILVCPGGGYHFTSEREAEIIAMQFNAMGYHTAVLRYSCKPAQFPTALLELSRAVAYLRAHAQKYMIDPERIAVLGFSAGGHLAASLGVFWNTEWFAKIREEAGVALTAQEIKPDGLILAYPVVTSGEYAHRDSFDDLLGEGRCKDPAWLAKMSLEKQNLKDVPPVFLWHTSYDSSVPLENSLYFATQLIKARKPLEYHIFPGDVHGISLADWRTRSEKRMEDTAAVQWIGLVHTWLEKWKKH